MGGICANVGMSHQNELVLENRATHSEISTQIKIWQHREARIKKVLLLGTGDAGKSTLMKQIRRAHIEEIPYVELVATISHVRHQICRSIQSILPNQMSTPSMSMDEEEKSPMPEEQILFQLRRDLVQAIDAAEKEEKEFFTAHVQQNIQLFWETDLAKSCFRERTTTQCMDTLPYFLNRLDAIGKTDYVPTVDDFLRVRIPTVGVRRHLLLQQHGKTTHPIEFFDVGGQRNERRKWVHVFDNVAAVLWIVSLSEYDQCLHEARDRNRYEESLHVFGETVANPVFSDTNFICFLNKKDLFDAKLKDTPFKLGKYRGDPHDEEQVIAYIQKEYTRIFDSVSGGKGRKLSFYVTCATDLNTVTNVSNQVLNNLLRSMIAKDDFI